MVTQLRYNSNHNTYVGVKQAINVIKMKYDSYKWLCVHETPTKMPSKAVTRGKIPVCSAEWHMQPRCPTRRGCEWFQSTSPYISGWICVAKNTQQRFLGGGGIGEACLLHGPSLIKTKHFIFLIIKKKKPCPLKSHLWWGVCCRIDESGKFKSKEVTGK